MPLCLRKNRLSILNYLDSPYLRRRSRRNSQSFCYPVARMREELVRLILERLERDKEKIAADFRSEKEVKTRYAVIDDLLPAEIAAKFAPAFPPLEEMRLMKSIREEK